MSFIGYEVIDTPNGPMVSQSRTTIYDILLTQQEGEDFNALCVIHNLQPLQVQVALVYIEENREQLEAELPDLLEKKAENERYHRSIAAEREKRIATLSMTPQREAFYALREKNKYSVNGHSSSHYGYDILETNIGPVVSQSRTSVYDILRSQQEGEDFYALCVIHNLKPLQVEAALEYIEVNRARLEAKLPGLLAKKAENERHHRAIAAEREKRIAALPMTPEREAYYALREKNRPLWSENGYSDPK